jgi:glycosyltransferase involved in cell wall biosynthesis
MTKIAGQPHSIFILHPSDYLTDHEPHGDGLTAFGFIHELAQRGYRLHVAARQVSLSSQFPENVTLHMIPRRIRIPLLDRLEYMVRARLLFRRLQRTESIQLVHQMNPVFAGMSLAFIGINVPLVLGTIVPKWPKDPDSIASRHPWIGKVLETVKNIIVNLQQKKATALLLTSPAAINRLPHPAELLTKVMFVPHGIDTELFSPAATRHSGPPTILFLANLQKRKGIYTLLEAFLAIAAAVPDCRLIVVGGGPEAASVAAYVDTLPFRSQIELIGNVARERVGDFLRQCSVYCLPSFGEPYGATVAEAMSCGIPVVVTKAGGFPYLVPETGGRFVPTGNPRALANALIEILSDQELQRSMGRVNREHAVTSLSWARAVDQLELGYRTAYTQHNLATRQTQQHLVTESSAGELPQ